MARESRQITKRKSTTRKIADSNYKALVLGTIVVVIALFAFISGNINHKNISQNLTPTPVEIPSASIPLTPMPTKRTEPKTKDIAIEAVVDGKSEQKPIVKTLPLTSGETFTYTVRKNDSLARIGKTFCDDKSAWLNLAEINKISSPYTLQPGETILVACQ